MKRLVFAALACCALAPSAPALGQEKSAFEAKVKPFVEAYCIRCHGPDVQKAGLRLDQLGANLTEEDSLAKWALVHDRVAASKMPPRKSEQPTPAEREKLTK